MTSPDKGTSGRGARWILVLALLAVGVGIALLFVAGGREKRGRSEGRATDPGARPSPRSSTASPGMGAGAGGGRAALDPRRVRERVDRRRLARLLGSGRTAAGSPGGEGPGGDGRRGPGTATGDGDPGTPEDPVWPLTAKGIKGAIKARIEEIKECYNGWLAMDDELGGKLVLAFRIERDPDGELARIASAEIQGSTVDHPGLERCVLVMAESLSFEPPPGDAVTVRYPFRFKSAAK